ncbi:Hypothetical predicted protein [Mytilus galloprovincialis]|uniref:Uncharacterized protein n=1 Tax=Mytilus galloprovincialis TaxID=29158 RepID=A0A8B6DRY0_MYTGA|nr:Hypothetical predicted protein [Mytilus galloprovincialis]
MKISSRSFISVVFVCFIRSTKGASLGTDRKNIHGSCPLQFKALTSTMDTNCRYRITNETTQLQYALQNNIKWEDGTTRPIHIKILTEGNDTIRTTTDILFPNQWMLSYIDPNGPYYYVSWRSDFKILSLGLLNGITDKPIQVDIRELSGNCTSILGSDDTTTYIVQVMTSFIRLAAVLGDDHDYENINLCYLTKFDWFLNSGWYLLKQYFGIPFQEFGYKCCMMRNDTVCCDDRLHAIEGYRVVPYLIAVVLIFYFPIILMKIGNSLRKFDDKSYLKDFSSHSINQKLDNSNSDDDFVSVFLINPFFLGLSNHDDQKVTDETGSQEKNCCYVTWRDFKNYYKNLFDMIVKVCEGKDQLKQKFIVSKDHAEYIKEEIIKVVFSKLSPVYVQIGHIILKFALVILVYVSSILFLNTNSEQLADLIEHITVLATSALPVIIQYQFKTICPTERLVKYTINSNLLEETNRDFDMR